MKVTYRNTIVTVYAETAPDARPKVGYTPTPGASDGVLPVDGIVTLDPGPRTTFDDLLNQAHHMLSHFHRSQPGSEWGCDGVGYMAQKAAGHVIVNKSGVGPRKYRKGLATIAACDACKKFA